MHALYALIMVQILHTPFTLCATVHICARQMLYICCSYAVSLQLCVYCIYCFRNVYLLYLWFSFIACIPHFVLILCIYVQSVHYIHTYSRYALYILYVKLYIPCIHPGLCPPSKAGSCRARSGRLARDTSLLGGLRRKQNSPGASKTHSKAVLSSLPERARHKPVMAE